MKNKGFTLVELLAVISIMGVVMILVVPTMLRALGNSKKLLNQYDLEGVEDAGKMYVNDMDEGLRDYKYTGSKAIVVNDKTITPGTVLSGYDLKVFIINQGGILVDMGTLVKEGYYNDGCHYAGETFGGKVLTEDLDCKLPKECTLRVGIDYKMSKDGVYYVTNGYKAEIVSGCE